jgi:hypothetical protein
VRQVFPSATSAANQHHRYNIKKRKAEEVDMSTHWRSQLEQLERYDTEIQNQIAEIKKRQQEFVQNKAHDRMHKIYTEIHHGREKKRLDLVQAMYLRYLKMLQAQHYDMDIPEKQKHDKYNLELPLWRQPGY